MKHHFPFCLRALKSSVTVRSLVTIFNGTVPVVPVTFALPTRFTDSPGGGFFGSPTLPLSQTTCSRVDLSAAITPATNRSAAVLSAATSSTAVDDCVVALLDFVVLEAAVAELAVELAAVAVGGSLDGTYSVVEVAVLAVLVVVATGGAACGLSSPFSRTTAVTPPPTNTAAAALTAMIGPFRLRRGGGGGGGAAHVWAYLTGLIS